MKALRAVPRIAGPAVALAVLCACNPQPPPAPAPAATSAPVATASAAPPARVLNWGQRSTRAGTPFNVQADGNSGVAFELDRAALPGEYRVTFAGRPLSGVVANGVIVTATIPSDYLARPGSFPVVVENPGQQVRMEAGEFTVEP